MNPIPSLKKIACTIHSFSSVIHPCQPFHRLFFFLSVFLVAHASAKTVTIGSGSGSLSVTSMSSIGLAAGDTLSITTGTYTGATFTNLNGITIVPATGGVTFTGGIGIGKITNVTFDGTVLPGVTYGYTFSGSTTHAFYPASGAYGNTQNDTIKGILCSNISQVIQGDGNLITYNGTSATALYYNLTLDTIKLTGGTTFYNGTYDATTTYHNVCIGLAMRNVIVASDGTGGSTKVRGNSIYQMVADGWTLSGLSTDTTQGDVGIFSIEGNATLRNIYRNGGWGYIARIFNASLYTSSDSYLYNIIDINSVKYGTVDCRVDPTTLNLTGAIPIVGNNLHAYNITSGNKSDVVGTYTTALLVLYSMSDGVKQYTAEVVNCLAFNAVGNNGKGSLVSYESSSLATLSNNVDITGPLPSGYLVDQTNCFPIAGSPLIGAGAVLAIDPTDIYGTARGSGYDIGAVQHLSAPTKFEAESLTIAAFSGPTPRVFADGNCSNAEAAIIDATAVGNYMTFLVPNVAAGSYDVKIGLKDLNTRGIFQLAIGRADNFSGTKSNVGPAVDEYNAGQTYPVVDLGTWSPGSTSDKWFQFLVTGKNTASTGYLISVDYILLTPQ